MIRKQPFQHHRFPAVVILCALRICLRYPLSYQDTADLLATHDAKAARAFMRRAIAKARLHRPVTICTEKSPSYRRVIRDINHSYDPHFDSITHIDKTWRNKRIESDHAALRRHLGYRQSFRSLSSAKATLCGIETIPTIKNRHVRDMKPGIQDEIALVHEVLGLAA